MANADQFAAGGRGYPLVITNTVIKTLLSKIGCYTEENTFMNRAIHVVYNIYVDLFLQLEN